MVFQLLPALMLLVPLAAAAAPPTSYPEVIPGPGFPTLASLGLTSAELYSESPVVRAWVPVLNRAHTTDLSVTPPEKRAVLYDAVCQTYTTADVDNVIACFNYLAKIGGNCVVHGENVNFCTVGDAAVTGSNTSGEESASSSCYDVALGLQWIFTNCNRGGQVGGSQAASGNGFLIVGVENFAYVES